MEGDVSELTENLASLGSWGLNPQNIERDLHRLCRRELGVDLDLHYFPIRVAKEVALKRPGKSVHEADDVADLVGEEVGESILGLTLLSSRIHGFSPIHFG